jgi:hypothetical protein
VHRASDGDRANVKGDIPTVATRIGKALLEEKQGSEIFVPRKCRDAISPAAGFNPDAGDTVCFARVSSATPPSTLDQPHRIWSDRRCSPRVIIVSSIPGFVDSVHDACAQPPCSSQSKVDIASLMRYRLASNIFHAEPFGCFRRPVRTG